MDGFPQIVKAIAGGLKKPVMMEVPNLRAGDRWRNPPEISEKIPSPETNKLGTFREKYLKVSLPTSVSGRFLLFVVDDFRRLRLNTLDIQNLSSHTWWGSVWVWNP